MAIFWPIPDSKETLIALDSRRGNLIFDFAVPPHAKSADAKFVFVLKTANCLGIVSLTA